jgi:hypothetical protein
MNLLSQQRKVKLHIEVWKTVFLNMLINYNLLYSFKHPDTAPQRNYKTLYCVLILTYLCVSLSCLNAANILFSSPADGGRLCWIFHVLSIPYASVINL